MRHSSFPCAIALAALSVMIVSVHADPAPRSYAEVESAIAPGELANPSSRPVRITLVWGDKDHGPNQHDYPRFESEWGAMLGTIAGVTLTAAKNKPTRDQWNTADLMVFYLNASWGDTDYAAMDAFLNRGGGALFIHQGVVQAGGGAKFALRLGLASNSSADGGKYQEGPLDLDMAQADAHAITRGLGKSIHMDDEAYWLLLGDTSRVQVLATTVKDGAARPMLWTHAQGKGVAIGSILGHNYWTFNDPLYRLILLRSMAFALGEPLGRFAPLVTRGLALTGVPSAIARPDPARLPESRAPVPGFSFDLRGRNLGTADPRRAWFGEPAGDVPYTNARNNGCRRDCAH